MCIRDRSLANGFRHGGAVKQHIVLGTSDSRLQVVVRDEGKGFDTHATETEGHLGLEGMRERVEILGGTFYVWSAVGEGTVVRADMPLTCLLYTSPSPRDRTRSR